MKCVIVDDDLYSIELLKAAINQVEDIKIVDVFSDPKEVVYYLMNEGEAIDVIFLDVHMPDISGFDIINSLNFKTNIVLTTTDNTAAVEAFEHDNIIDFIQKPVTAIRLLKTIAKLKKLEKKGANKSMFLNINKKLTKIDINDIAFIKSASDYIVFELCDKNSYIVHRTLKSIESELKYFSFIRVHRSYLVNYERIENIEQNGISIVGKIIPIGKNYRKELFEKLNLF